MLLILISIDRIVLTLTVRIGQNNRLGYTHYDLLPIQALLLWWLVLRCLSLDFGRISLLTLSIYVNMDDDSDSKA